MPCSIQQLRSDRATAARKKRSLRESVRRLVGEWEKKSEDLWNNRPENDSRPKSEAISQCADELSALIDGKEQS